MPITKYDLKLESFFDLYFFYPISEFLMPIFKALFFTPNMITTLSFIALAIATYFLFIDTRIAAFLLLISYVFDCLDGMFARKYNMCSPFGMAYDYTKDWFMNSIFCIGLIYQYTLFYSLNIFIVLFSTILVAYLCLTWLGINEAAVHYKTHQNTNYYSYRKKLFVKRNIGNIIYLSLSKFFYSMVKPYIKNPVKMRNYAIFLKFFGLGNLVMLCFLVMNIWVIV